MRSRLRPHSPVPRRPVLEGEVGLRISNNSSNSYLSHVISPVTEPSRLGIAAPLTGASTPGPGG